MNPSLPLEVITQIIEDILSDHIHATWTYMNYKPIRSPITALLLTSRTFRKVAEMVLAHLLGPNIPESVSRFILDVQDVFSLACQHGMMYLSWSELAPLPNEVPSTSELQDLMRSGYSMAKVCPLVMIYAKLNAVDCAVRFMHHADANTSRAIKLDVWEHFDSSLVPKGFDDIDELRGGENHLHVRAHSSYGMKAAMFLQIGTWLRVLTIAESLADRLPQGRVRTRSRAQFDELHKGVSDEVLAFMKYLSEMMDGATSVQVTAPAAPGSCQSALSGFQLAMASAAEVAGLPRILLDLQTKRLTDEAMDAVALLNAKLEARIAALYEQE